MSPARPIVRFPSSAALLIIALGGSSLLTGCAGPNTPAPRQSPRAGADPIRTTNPPAPPSPPAPIVTMGPTSARTLAYAVPRELEYVSANSRRSLVIRRGPPPDCLCAGRTWTIKGYELDGPPDAARAAVDSGQVTPTWERTYTVLPGGGIGLTEQIDRAERVEVVFTPPMLIMPDNLPIHALGSAEMAQDFTMTVHPLGDRARVKSKGPARTLVRYAADEALSTPAGAFTARRLETTLTADLAPAKVNNTTRQWFVENVGLVKEADRETTKVLGLSVRNNTSEWTLHAFR